MGLITRLWNYATACAAEAGPTENRPLGAFRASRSDQRLFLIEWELNGEQGLNHYLLGSPPFDLARYRAWLPSLILCDLATLIRCGPLPVPEGA